MSLILEALKKSEHKRRLGDTPHLGTPLMHTPRRRNFLPLLLGCILVALGAGWWVLHRGETNVAPPQKTDHSPIQQSVTQTAQTIATTAPISSIKPDPPAAVPTTPQSAPHPAKSNASNATAPPSVASTAVSNSNTPSSVERNQPASTVTTPTTVTPPTVTTSTTVPATATAVARPEVAATAPATVPSASATPQEPHPESSVNSSFPFYYQLAYPLRKDLPSLKISMHVFSADPAQRFAIINGTRQVEGDTIGTDLILSEIRPAEIVLEFRNQRFIVPRGGM